MGGMFGLSAVSEGLGDKGEAVFMSNIEPLLPMAYRLAYGLLRRPEEAEDAVQEATFNAWRRQATFRSGSEIRPWFLAIVANQCRQMTRAGWWSVIRLAEPGEEPAGTGGASSEDVWILRQAISRLSPADRLVLVLRYYLDLSYDEVAATLRISPPAARVRAHRALARLRPKVIVREEFEDG
jgi:RNA polymerase sigma-70 factor (ECF subfamily)